MAESMVDAVVSSGRGVDRDAALELADAAWPLSTVLHAARTIREAFHGERVRRCAIINARSGACSEDCRFCAQSVHHPTDAAVFPLTDRGTLIAAARRAREADVSCFGIVTAGRKPGAEELAEIAAHVRACRELGLRGVGVSLGILDRAELCALKQAGVNHYNHNLETSRRFYPQICTTHSWDERYQTVADALAEGLEVCSGGIFGLGESWEDRIDMALALRELGVRRVPMNFLVPVAGTPLGQREPLSAEEALRILAIYRHLLPRADLSVCGGRPQTFGAQQERAFAAGATGLMTGDYLTTSGFGYDEDLAMLRRLGLRCECDAASG
ncbi:MAG: biotin synthase BioB [Planctomycetota bacterium]